MKLITREDITVVFIIACLQIAMGITGCWLIVMGLGLSWKVGLGLYCIIWVFTPQVKP